MPAVNSLSFRAFKGNYAYYENLTSLPFLMKFLEVSATHMCV